MVKIKADDITLARFLLRSRRSATFATQLAIGDGWTSASLVIGARQGTRNPFVDQPELGNGL